MKWVLGVIDGRSLALLIELPVISSVKRAFMSESSLSERSEAGKSASCIAVFERSVSFPVCLLRFPIFLHIDEASPAGIMVGNKSPRGGPPSDTLVAMHEIVSMSCLNMSLGILTHSGCFRSSLNRSNHAIRG